MFAIPSVITKRRKIFQSLFFYAENLFNSNAERICNNIWSDFLR